LRIFTAGARELSHCNSLFVERRAADSLWALLRASISFAMKRSLR
jgi:hypothetical protein